jgi:hypothetical protein
VGVITCPPAPARATSPSRHSARRGPCTHQGRARSPPRCSASQARSGRGRMLLRHRAGSISQLGRTSALVWTASAAPKMPRQDGLDGCFRQPSERARKLARRCRIGRGALVWVPAYRTTALPWRKQESRRGAVRLSSFVQLGGLGGVGLGARILTEALVLIIAACLLLTGLALRPRLARGAGVPRGDDL